jgi:chloride channel protein, CIC family
MLGVVLVPGLLAAGVGSLIFVGLDAWTGFGTFSLAVPNIPPAGTPDGAELLWALGIGVAAAVLGMRSEYWPCFSGPSSNAGACSSHRSSA